MKTIVLQSYRKENVPNWIRSCLQSVENWAAIKGFDYKFIDDRFFDYAPDWFRKRCGKEFYPVTDIARLYLLRENLNNGYDRALWVDADVIVFNNTDFNIDDNNGYAFCHEIMLGIGPDKKLVLSKNSLNNAVMIFEHGHPMLNFYIFSAEEIIRNTPPDKIFRTIIGPDLLVRLSRFMPVYRLTCVGLYTPVYMQALAADKKNIIEAYRNQFGFDMYAANLCHFHRNLESDQNKLIMDKLFENIIKLLVESKGELVNKKGLR